MRAGALVMCGDGLVSANDYFCNSIGYENGAALSARPVVTLKSNVTTNEVSIREGEVIEDWDNPLGMY